MADDPDNDKGLLVMHSYHYAKPDRLGVYVYDPETNAWAADRWPCPRSRATRRSRTASTTPS